MPMLGLQSGRTIGNPRPVLAVFLLAAFVFVLTPIRQAAAQIGSYRYASIVVDAGSGAVLSSVNADAPRYPASLVKVMTVYMTLEALRDRRVSLSQQVPISEHASSMEPTKLGLVPGSRITVEQAILGLITKSANDAAAALAELLGGTEERFAQMMTLRARSLGMSSTVFANASGLPDTRQTTTARDMAVLARRLIADFPVQYRYFSTPSFVWHGKTMHNHNHLLAGYPGADGLKTGYTQASGYNLIASAMRGGVRTIGVVMGASTGGERDLHMVGLLNAGFDKLDVPTERRGPTYASRGGAIIGSANAAPAEPTRPGPRARNAATAWSIQAGSFPAEKPARDAAVQARRAADAGEAKVEQATVGKKTVWRAIVVGLSERDASAACATLARRRAPCLAMRPEMMRMAQR
jgi:D-alanyl-D-alanine carboxypeptidase